MDLQRNVGAALILLAASAGCGSKTGLDGRGIASDDDPAGAAPAPSAPSGPGSSSGGTGGGGRGNPCPATAPTPGAACDVDSRVACGPYGAGGRCPIEAACADSRWLTRDCFATIDDGP